MHSIAMKTDYIKFKKIGLTKIVCLTSLLAPTQTDMNLKSTMSRMVRTVRGGLYHVTQLKDSSDVYEVRYTSDM